MNINNPMKRAGGGIVSAATDRSFEVRREVIQIDSEDDGPRECGHLIHLPLDGYYVVDADGYLPRRDVPDAVVATDRGHHWVYVGKPPDLAAVKAGDENYDLMARGVRGGWQMRIFSKIAPYLRRSAIALTPDGYQFALKWNATADSVGAFDPEKR